MDNGQPVNNPNQGPFFTAGIGNAPEGVNPERSNSFSYDTYTAEHDPKNIGSAARISSSTEQAPTTTEMLPGNQISGEAINNPALGQIVNLEMPLGMETPDKAIQNTEQVSVENASKPEETGVKAAKTAEAKLSKDGDAASFYKTIQDSRGTEK